MRALRLIGAVLVCLPALSTLAAEPARHEAAQIVGEMVLWYRQPGQKMARRPAARQRHHGGDGLRRGHARADRPE